MPLRRETKRRPFLLRRAVRLDGARVAIPRHREHGGPRHSVPLHARGVARDLPLQGGEPGGEGGIRGRVPRAEALVQQGELHRKALQEGCEGHIRDAGLGSHKEWAPVAAQGPVNLPERIIEIGAGDRRSPAVEEGGAGGGAAAGRQHRPHRPRELHRLFSQPRIVGQEAPPPSREALVHLQEDIEALPRQLGVPRPAYHRRPAPAHRVVEAGLGALVVHEDLVEGAPFHHKAQPHPLRVGAPAVAIPVKHGRAGSRGGVRPGEVERRVPHGLGGGGREACLEVPPLRRPARQRHRSAGPGPPSRGGHRSVAREAGRGGEAPAAGRCGSWEARGATGPRGGYHVGSNQHPQYTNTLV
mmetsp:Transcript_65819/g.208317  ORF Transcript_65819/g.208317 Transcript_65819/m.208317 type:complete len:357 (-) Transcript_65819:13-1083(-)